MMKFPFKIKNSVNNENYYYLDEVINMIFQTCKDKKINISTKPCDSDAGGGQDGSYVMEGYKYYENNIEKIIIIMLSQSDNNILIDINIIEDIQTQEYTSYEKIGDLGICVIKNFKNKLNEWKLKGLIELIE